MEQVNTGSWFIIVSLLVLVYSKAVTQILQVIGAPLMQQLQELIEHNNTVLASLQSEKQQLESELANTDLV